MKNIISVRRLSKLENTYQQKPNILLSAFCLISIGVSILFSLIDFILQQQNIIFINLIITVVYSIVYVLNEKRHHKLAKMIFFTFANTALFTYSNILPEDFGVYFFFFPLIGMSHLLFGYKELNLKIVFIFISIILFTVTEIYDYKVFGTIYGFEHFSNPFSHAINLSLSLLMLTLTIIYMNSLNRSIEEKLFKVNQELEMFFYRSSHDLREPLARSRGLLNLAEMTSDEKEIRSLLGRISGSLGSLEEILSDLIDATRVRSGEVKLEEVNIELLFDELISRESKIETGEVTVRKELNGQTIRTDKTFMKLILRNLISNAIKYRREIKESFISFQTEKTGDRFEMILQDNGIGMEEGITDKIFDMFYRGTDERQTGSGLGLFILKNAVDKLGGSIEVKSVVNEGTTFRINFFNV